MVKDKNEVLKHAQTVVVGNNDPDYRDVLAQLREDQTLVDFVRISDQRSKDGYYKGICW
jgi:GDP-mannose 6-dehydrogenase